MNKELLTLKEVEQKTVSDLIKHKESLTGESFESAVYTIKEYLMENLIGIGRLGIYQTDRIDLIKFCASQILPPTPTVRTNITVSCEVYYHIYVQKVEDTGNKVVYGISDYPILFESAFFTFGNVPRWDWGSAKLTQDFKTVIPAYEHTKIWYGYHLDITRYRWIYDKIPVDVIVSRMASHAEEIVYQAMLKDLPKGYANGVALGFTKLDWNSVSASAYFYREDKKTDKPPILIENIFMDLATFYHIDKPLE